MNAAEVEVQRIVAEAKEDCGGDAWHERATILDELRVSINRAVSSAQGHAREAVLDAVRAGTFLVEAKKQIGYGGWEQWVEKYCHLSLRSAQSYMRLAQRFPQLPDEEAQRVALLPLREAIQAISAVPDAQSATHKKKAGSVVAKTEWDRALATADKTSVRVNEFRRSVRARHIDAARIDVLRNQLRALLKAVDALLESPPRERLDA